MTSQVDDGEAARHKDPEERPSSLGSGGHDGVGVVVVVDVHDDDDDERVDGGGGVRNYDGDRGGGDDEENDNVDDGRGQGEDPGREEEDDVEEVVRLRRYASSLEAAMDLAMMAEEVDSGDDGDGGGDGDGEGEEDIGSEDVDEEGERDFEQQDRSREENGESSSSRPLSDSIAAATTAAAATPLVPEERSSERRSPLGASPSSTAKASSDRGDDGDSSGEKRTPSLSPPSSSKRRKKTKSGRRRLSSGGKSVDWNGESMSRMIHKEDGGIAGGGVIISIRRSKRESRMRSTSDEVLISSILSRADDGSVRRTWGVPGGRIGDDDEGAKEEEAMWEDDDDDDSDEGNFDCEHDEKNKRKSVSFLADSKRLGKHSYRDGGVGEGGGGSSSNGSSSDGGVMIRVRRSKKECRRRSTSDEAFIRSILSRADDGSIRRMWSASGRRVSDDDDHTNEDYDNNKDRKRNSPSFCADLKRRWINSYRRLRTSLSSDCRIAGAYSRIPLLTFLLFAALCGGGIATTLIAADRYAQDERMTAYQYGIVGRQLLTNQMDETLEAVRELVDAVKEDAVLRELPYQIGAPNEVGSRPILSPVPAPAPAAEEEVEVEEGQKWGGHDRRSLRRRSAGRRFGERNDWRDGGREKERRRRMHETVNHRDHDDEGHQWPPSENGNGGNDPDDVRLSDVLLEDGNDARGEDVHSSNGGGVSLGDHDAQLHDDDDNAPAYVRNVTGICDDPSLIFRFETLISETVRRAASRHDGVVIERTTLAPHGMVCLSWPSSPPEESSSSSSRYRLGLDLLAHPDYRERTEEVLSSPRLMFEGPFQVSTTTSNGTAITTWMIVHVPVAMPSDLDHSMDDHWGVLEVAFDWDAFVRGSGIAQFFDDLRRGGAEGGGGDGEGVQFVLARGISLEEGGRRRSGGSSSRSSPPLPPAILAKSEGITDEAVRHDAPNNQRFVYLGLDFRDANGEEWTLGVGSSVGGDRPPWFDAAICLSVLLSFFVTWLFLCVLVSRRRHVELLRELVPSQRALRTVRRGESYAEAFDFATLFFGDVTIADSSSSSRAFSESDENRMRPLDVVKTLDAFRAEADALADKHRLCRMETSGGDGGAYLYVASCPERCTGPLGAQRAALFALDMMELVDNFRFPDDDGNDDGGSRQQRMSLRCGLDSGRVVAGAVGEGNTRNNHNKTLPRFSVYGEAVSNARRLGSTSCGMGIQCSDATRRLLHDAPNFSFVCSQLTDGDGGAVADTNGARDGERMQRTWWIDSAFPVGKDYSTDGGAAADAAPTTSNPASQHKFNY